MNNLKEIKRIAVIVDDDKRTTLIEWSYFNRHILNQFEIIANEATADLLRGTLDIPITVVESDSGDGYHELLKLVQQDGVDILIFFGNISKEDLHQSGIRDLLVLATTQNIISASNPVTASFVMQALQANVYLPEDTKPYVPRDSAYEHEIGKVLRNAV